jgi:hypothetical protein
MRLLIVTGVLICLATAGTAKRVYQGQEAAALRCANALALTAVALAGAGRIPEAEKDVMLGVTLLMLENHVSGSWAQKKSALRVMRDRRTPVETLDDYRRNAQKCLRQFPIN